VIRSTPFRVSTKIDGESASIAIVGELDLSTAPRVEEALDDLLANRARRVVIDLSQVAFVDSSGLRMLIAMSDRSGEEGWTLALVRPPEPARSVFQITGAEQNLPFVEEGPPPR
jgi:anti-anti-sigma factor